MSQFFSKASFDRVSSVQSSTELPQAFERLVKNSNNKRIYSLYAVPKPEDRDKAFVRDALLAATMNYLNNSKTPEQRVGEWCYNCGNRDICLRSYAPDVFSEVE